MMNKRLGWLGLICWAGWLTAEAQPLATPSSSAVQAKPNILFFLVDDMGWMDASCYGSSVYETPTLDRLAVEGVRFTRAYAAYPRCVPSRYALMTGRHPARAGIPARGEHMKAEERTMAEAFRDGGYATFFAGKWHLMHAEDEGPQRQGFTVSIGGGRAGAAGSHFAPYNVSRGQGHEAESPLPGLDDAPEGEYLADRLTEETLRFIHRHREEHPEQPFFAYLSHYAVHSPIEAKPEKVARYQAKIDGITFEGEGYVDRDGTTKMHQDNATYAAMVESVDESLGRLLSTLDELGIAEQTIVLMTSDHGGLSNRGRQNNRTLATSNEPLRAGKGHLYEGGLRVPLLLRWPGRFKAGLVSDCVTMGTDHFPTLLELAGLPLEPENHRDGWSYAGILNGDVQERPSPLFWHSPKARPHNTVDVNASAIFSGPYKLMDFYDQDRVDLYHVERDVGEQQNLLDSEPEVTARLRKQLQDWKSALPK